MRNDGSNQAWTYPGPPEELDARWRRYALVLWASRLSIVIWIATIAGTAIFALPSWAVFAVFVSIAAVQFARHAFRCPRCGEAFAGPGRRAHDKGNSCYHCGLERRGATR